MGHKEEATSGDIKAQVEGATANEEQNNEKSA